MERSYFCGNIASQAQGEEVTLVGWLQARRDHGHFVFVDLKDRTGFVQVVLDRQALPVASELRGDWVLKIKGKVVLRAKEAINSKIPTGDVEVVASSCQVLSPAKTLPFLTEDKNVSEHLQLKYRYLHLRSQQMQNNLKARHDVVLAIRNYLSQHDFWEIETPILCKSTPEGARDYLVPSRLHPGAFYALPQSPQILKQLLMAAGTDRYFQIVRCFRDEDLRADRQPEFTQIDVEMSFVEEKDVMDTLESLICFLWEKFKNVKLKPFPVLSFEEAMSLYGTDKPDLRIPWKIKDISKDVSDLNFPVFKEAVHSQKAVRGFVASQSVEFSRSQLDKLSELIKQNGAQSLFWIKVQKGAVTSSIKKFLSEKELLFIFKALGGKDQGMAFLVVDSWKISSQALGALRSHLGHKLQVIPPGSREEFLWVVDFPSFEYDEKEKRWVSSHHPFTSPQTKDLECLEKGEYESVKSRSYDLVCNGYELASGSVRIHKSDLQEKVLKVLGFSEKQVQDQFGFFN